MAEVIAAHETDLLTTLPKAPILLFDEVVAAWFEYLENEKRVKPSTLAGYRCLLAQPSGKPDQRGARIMRTFGGGPILEITVGAIKEFLSKLDREDISARTVNIHRQFMGRFEQHLQSAIGLTPTTDSTRRHERTDGPSREADH
jgi:hypothetical protein